jgi:hypothetical protein
MVNAYAVLAEVRQGVEHDLLAVYSTRALAKAFTDAQDEQLRQCLVICEVEIDKHPSDPYWRKPHGLAGAFHALAGIPEDALPGDRVANVAGASERVRLGTLLASIAREAGGLTADEAEAFGAGRRGTEAKAPATLDEVRRLACELVGPALVDAWLDRPLASAGGRTPRQLVAEGRGDAVLHYLRQSGPIA